MASADELVKQLLAGDPKAAAALAWMDREEALDALNAGRPLIWKRLPDLLLWDPPVAHLAASAVARYNDYHAVLALRDALRRGGAFQRRYAAAALGTIRSDASTEAAAALCKARAACDAGGRDDEYIQIITTSLLELADAAVVPLCHTLITGSASVRAWAVELLRRLRDPRAVKPLCARLRDPEAQVRREAAWTLRDLGDSQAIPALAVALSDADASVRWHVVQALRTVGWQPATPHDQVAYLLARDDDYWKVRMTGPAAVGPLVSFLRHPDATLRTRAAEGLGWLGDRRALPALRARVGLLGERDRRVVETIRLAIERIADATDEVAGLPRAEAPDLDLNGRPRECSEAPMPDQRPRPSIPPEGFL